MKIEQRVQENKLNKRKSKQQELGGQKSSSEQSVIQRVQQI
jgi:hypothetical protein